MLAGTEALKFLGTLAFPILAGSHGRRAKLSGSASSLQRAAALAGGRSSLALLGVLEELLQLLDYGSKGRPVVGVRGPHLFYELFHSIAHRILRDRTIGGRAVRHANRSVSQGAEVGRFQGPQITACKSALPDTRSDTFQAFGGLEVGVKNHV